MNNCNFKNSLPNELLSNRFNWLENKISLLLKLLKNEKIFNNLKEWDMVCRSVIHSIFIDTYWVSEYLDIKTKPNLNNPFYIWAKMFDTLKHYERTQYVDENITTKKHNKSTYYSDTLGFLLNFKCKRDYISNDDFKELMFRFILPMEIDIQPGLIFFEQSRHISIIFWNSIKNFFNWLKNTNIQIINNEELFKCYMESSNIFNSEIKKCWNMLKQITDTLNNKNT